MIEFLIGLILVALAVAYSGLTWGLVCFEYWKWFMLPVFPGLPHISYWQAVGLMFFISLFRNINASTTNTTDDIKENIVKIIQGLLIPWVSLLIGYIFYGIIS
jgi:hypothetical protein